MPPTPPASPRRGSTGWTVAASLGSCVLALHSAPALAASPGPSPAGPVMPAGRVSTDGPSIQRYLENGLAGARQVLPSGRVLTIVGTEADGGRLCRHFVVSDPNGGGSSGIGCRQGPGVWNLSEGAAPSGPVAGRPLPVPQTYAASPSYVRPSYASPGYAPPAYAPPPSYVAPVPYPAAAMAPQPVMMPPPNPAANIVLPMAVIMLRALGGGGGHLGWCPP